jgi:uncharacterized protein (TIGR02231 family)
MILMMTLLFSAPETSKIDAVVVFADRAKVTRVTSADCTNGVANAVFEPLPISLDVRTLRGDAKGGTAIGVASSEISDEGALTGKAKELVEESKSLSEKVLAKQNERASLEVQTRRMGEYGGLFARVLAEEIRNPQPPILIWGQTLDRMRKEESAADAKKLAVERELRALFRDQTRVQRRLERLGVAAQKRARRAEVAVRCQDPKVQVALTYVLPGAQWRPEYDFDFTAASGKVGAGDARMTVAAVEQQATGEDWTDVKVSLSTAKPKLGTGARYPAPSWLTAEKEKKRQVLGEGYEKRDELATGTAAPTTPGREGVELDDGGQAVVLTLPHRVSVVADGRPYWAPVDAIAAKGTAALVAIPKLRPYVFRMLSLKNPAAYPLLEGRVHSYRGGSYVGDTSLRFKGTGEPMEVSLGIDEELTVERKVLTHQDRGASFLSSTKHMARAFRMVVKNRSKTREKVELRENVPVSKIEDVEVELIAAGTSAGYQLDKTRGFIVWTLDLPPGAEKEVNLAYEIHLPEDWKASNF